MYKLIAGVVVTGFLGFAVASVSHARQAEQSLCTKFNSPQYPYEHLKWDAKYSGFVDAKDCQDYARGIWKRYFESYQNEIGVLSTFCSAYANKQQWTSVIICNRSADCIITTSTK